MVEKRQNLSQNKKQSSSSRRKLLTDDERFQSIFDAVKKDFEVMNARQTCHHDSAGQVSLNNLSTGCLEATLNDLNDSNSSRISLKDRMMLASSFEDHLFHREDHHRSIGEILEEFPRQQRRKFLGGEISKQLGSSSETSAKAAPIEDFAFDRSRLTAPKSSIAMMRQSRHHDEPTMNRNSF
jgi:hypothetical protein